MCEHIGNQCRLSTKFSKILPKRPAPTFPKLVKPLYSLFIERLALIDKFTGQKTFGSPQNFLLFFQAD
jgi:hypothetical protein